MEICKVAGLSVATASLNWSTLNAALTAALLVSNIIFIWWKMKRKRK